MADSGNDGCVTEDGMLRRREFLRYFTLLVGALSLPAGVGGAMAFPPGGKGNAATGEGPREFEFAQLVYRGGNWDPDPGASRHLIKKLETSTSIEARGDRVTVDLDSPTLFRYPFLYMTGDGYFEKFSDVNIVTLRKYLKAGGTLVGDDSASAPGHGFDASFRREMERVFPENALERLPADHTVFRSFFLIRGAGGRRIVSPFLEGISLDKRTPVIYSPNGLGPAWAKDRYGKWLYEIVPGGERQRRLAFQLGINLVMYALCSDYKQDRIHLPFLRQKI